MLKLRKFKAFTMVEVIGVILLLGVIAAALVPAFMADNAGSQSKALSSKILSDLQAIEMKANECFDTYGAWPTNAGSALTATPSLVTNMWCNGISVEGTNRFFTPKSPNGFNTYTISHPGTTTTDIAVVLTWSSTLSMINQNALTTLQTQVSTTKLPAFAVNGVTGTITYYVTK